MSVASQVNAYRPLGVLLGGPFAPQRSIEPKPLVCALLVALPRSAATQAPDPAARRVESLLRQMTLEEKVGQMTQIALQALVSRGGGPGTPVQIDSAKLHEAVVRRGVGALLNVAYVAMSPEEWRATNEMIARFAARARLKVPVVAIVDTNCDPDLVEFPVAGNDDAIRAVRIILATIGQNGATAVTILMLIDVNARVAVSMTTCCRKVETWIGVPRRNDAGVANVPALVVR